MAPLIELIELTTKHHCRRAASDALSLIGTATQIIHTQGECVSIAELVTNRRTPPLVGGSLFLKGEFDVSEKTLDQRTGRASSLHAR